MITISGPATLCDASLGMTSGGVMQLKVIATAPCQGRPDGTRFVLVWTGDKAACFHADFGHVLKLGAQLWFDAQDPRPLMDRGELCVMANALDIQVTKRGARPVIKASARTWRASLEGVAA